MPHKPTTKFHSLIEQAKLIRRNSKLPNIPLEEAALAVAWLKNDITTHQYQRVLNLSTSGGSTVYRIANALRVAYANNLIKEA